VRQKYSILLVFLLALAALARPAAAAPMATGAAVVPPAGFIGFCARHLSECSGARTPVVVALTPERRHELEAVQAEVNASIRPREDPAHVWDYPADGTGDCNKFALAKRRALIALGWPREALLLTAALTEGGEGHLVLLVRTDAGDLVLDNRLAPVVDWTRLPYRWLSRQSARNPALWVGILPAAQTLADAR
jgi:predicted transglutaminase-like cysteine proteinase